MQFYDIFVAICLIALLLVAGIIVVTIVSNHAPISLA